MSSHNAWPTDRVERLRQLVAESHSASEIAAILGMGLTRNAIIGRIHRMRLSLAPNRGGYTRGSVRSHNRTSGPPKARVARPVRPPRPPRVRSMKPVAPRPPMPSMPAPDSLNLPMMALTDKPQHMCRWTIGAATGAQQLFCGVATAGCEESWCDFHRQRGYVPDKPRQRSGARL